MKIYNLIVLDKSGSMTPVRYQAMHGCNQTFKSIRKGQISDESGEMEQFVTLLLFDNLGFDYLYENAPINEVKDLTIEDYAPFGSTPLYDAMGGSLTRLSEFLKDESGYNVLVTVITDGEENASKEYSGETISKLISALKEQGWLFTYIGADHDVEKVAFELNIKSTLRFDRSGEGVDKMWDKVNLSREKYFNDILSSSKCDQRELNKRIMMFDDIFFEE